MARSGDVRSAIKGKLSVNHSGFRLREVLVGAQLSFSILMIALILIIVDQFQYINTADKGFEDKNTLVIKIPFGSFSETETLEQSLLQLNGVQKTGASSFYTDEIFWGDLFNIEYENGKKPVLVKEEYWGYDFADLLNIEVVKGRDFDRERVTDKYQGFLINETAAKAFGWKDPIGKKINNGYVIGVVKDFYLSSLHEKIEPLFIYHGGSDHWDAEYVFLKLDPIRSANLISQIEREYNKFYEDAPFEWEYLDSIFANLYKHDYQVRDIFQIGLVISILVSCMGIFSISALLVLLRAKEMGIRKVVGANELQLFGLHSMNFAKFIGIAVLIAWPITYYLSNHWLDNFAYRIDLNIGYFVIPGLITVLIILLASGFHGVRSSKINPVEILNQE